MRKTGGLLVAVLVLLLAGTPYVGAQTTTVVPKGKMVLAWHITIASRWLDPQEPDGTATLANFLNAIHNALIWISPVWSEFDSSCTRPDIPMALT